MLTTGLEEQRLKTEIPKVWKRMTVGPDMELEELIRTRVKERTGLDAATSHIASVLGMVIAKPVQQPSASEPGSIYLTNRKDAVNFNG